jgi:hypothetical protein
MNQENKKRTGRPQVAMASGKSGKSGKFNVDEWADEPGR